MVQYSRLLGMLFSLFLLACEDEAPTPSDVPGLPPITQEGRNTLGFLLNGEPWVPQGKRGNRALSNPDAFYDGGFLGGQVSISGLAIPEANEFIRSQFVIGLTNVNHKNEFDLAGRDLGFLYTASLCDFRSSDTTLNEVGWLIISRLDLEARIISGTFEFTAIQPGVEGCSSDTLRITQGRFDLRL